MIRALCLPAWVLLAAVSGACDRTQSPPLAPVQSVPARGPGPAPTTATPPPPPPKEAPANQSPDAPASPAAAAPQVEEKLAPPAGEKPQPVVKPRGPVREIRPAEGATNCVEMYGTCTPPPERLCTTTALAVDCGARAQVPSSGEWVQCVCPK